MAAQDSFDRAKRQILSDLGVVDYSPKGSVDREIVPLINLVNAHADLVTTSSCAGRVSVFIEGDKSGDKLRVGGKGVGGHWLFFTHDPAELVPQWRAGLDAYEHACAVAPEEPRRYVLYKFEPFILHVRCRTHAVARRLFSLALANGFRETGIGSNDNVAIRISMRVDAPVGYLAGRRIHKLASPEYLAALDAMALELFAKNRQRIDQLAAALARFETPRAAPRESREDRARKNRARGLRAQSEKRAAPAASDAASDVADEEPVYTMFEPC